MTSHRKRLLISKSVAILPARKTEKTSRKGSIVISSQASLTLLMTNKMNNSFAQVMMKGSITPEKVSDDIIHGTDSK